MPGIVCLSCTPARRSAASPISSFTVSCKTCPERAARAVCARAAQPRTALAARRCMCSEATPQADPNESGPFTNPSGPIRLPALPRGALLNMYFCLAAGARYARWALKALAASYIGASSFHYFCQKGAPPPSLLQDASTMHPIMASSQSFIISLIIITSSSSPNLQ